MRALLDIVFVMVGIAIGVIGMGLVVRKSDLDDYNEGYMDGKNEMRAQMDDLCSHCGKVGR